MKTVLKVGIVIVAMSGIFACSHQPVVPDAKNVTVRREKPSDKCTDMGKVVGGVISTHGTVEEAIEDMKSNAARMGANYVQMEQTSSMSTSVTGEAFNCM